MSKPKVSVAKCKELKGNESFMNGKFVRHDEDVARIKETVAKAVELAIGSLDKIIKEGQTVLIKPNTCRKSRCG